MPLTGNVVGLVNINQTAGTQSGARVTALQDGGYVVAWTNQDPGQPLGVWMQRYDANGAAVGSQQAAIVSGTQITLSDMTVASDGRIWMAASNGTSAIVRSFDPVTLLPSFTELFQSVPGNILGVQIDAAAGGAPGSVALVVGSDPGGANTNILRCEVSASGASTGFSTLNTTPTTSLIEHFDGRLTIGTFDSQHYVFMGGGTPVSIFSPNKPSDLVMLRPDLYVASLRSTTSSDLSLMPIMVSSSGAITVGTAVPAGFTSFGIPTAGQNVYDAKLIALDANRVLMLWVSDGGDSLPPGGGTPIQDGIYAQVVNITTGSVGTGTLLQGLGLTFNEGALLGADISASVLADGRVAVTFNMPSGLFTDSNIHHAIIEDRTSAVSVTASASADIFVGTAFGDTFTGVSTGDSINGGNGDDTVVFGGATARLVDLADPAAFPETVMSLISIENLTGGNGSDGLYGNAARNVLLGGAGNDTLSGRGGSDSLAGGIGNDQIFGSAGDDTLVGDTFNDSLYGGGDNDLVLGGIGDDIAAGGTGNDTIFGGDGDDRTYGDAGADQIDGGAGADFIDGGADDDWIQGGLGNDTIRADSGADSLNGGDGDDRFIAAADVALVDGGAGIDTLTVEAASANPFATGHYVDLSAGELQFDALLALPEFTGIITGIENLTGGAGADFLIGSDTANVLRGGGGADTLVGAGANDTLIGGEGADVFIFVNTIGGNDRVTGFEIGIDNLALSADAFGDLASADLTTRLTISGTGVVAANASAQLTFDNAGAGAGRLFFDEDGNGAAVAVLLATLTFATPAGLTTFSASDFVFI